MATWPTTLPKPLASGFNIQAGDAVVRTDMDSGAARVRRRVRSAIDKVTLKFFFTDAQMVIFRAFWENEMAHGSAWVFFPIRDGRSTSVVSKECRPTQAFKADILPASAQWMVEIAVEIRNA